MCLLSMYIYRERHIIYTYNLDKNKVWWNEMSLIDIVILIIEIGVGMCCNQNNQILQPWVELKNKMEATNPNVFTFLDYECKPLQ